MPEQIGVGLIGLGTVGRAVARRLIEQWEMLGRRAGAVPVLRRVAVQDPRRSRDIDLKNAVLDADAAALVDDPTVDIVVEAIPGANPATALIERALAQGKTVVTANKAVIAPSGPRLWALAQQHGAGLWFEAAAGGGLPVVALLRDSLRGDNISGICGVINATTNVILTRMRNTGDTLAAALSGAQRRGVAEADPSSDLDGWDATYKLVILSWLAFGAHVAPEDVRRTGIRELDVVDLGYTGQLGYTVKLLASARMAVGAAELEIGVQPTAIPEGHPLFGVDDAANAVIITGDLQAETFVRGAGGEGPSTASAVVSDVVNAVRSRGKELAPPPLRAFALRSDEDVEACAYLRLETGRDQDASLLIAQALEDRGVRVVETYGKPPLDGPFPQLIILTGSAPRAVLGRAVDTLDSLPSVRSVRCVMDRLEPS